MLTRVSITGADDQVDVTHLARLSRQYLNAEWAILYFPEREGTPRNPAPGWREQFLEQRLPHTAAHLCGERVFRDILAPASGQGRLADLARYGRVQLNINARTPIFTELEVLSVYRRLLDAGLTIILQYHPESMRVVNDLLLSVTKAELPRVHILFDSSKGTGVVPAQWASPVAIDQEPLYCGYAGGLGPAVLEAQLPLIAEAANGQHYWIDMESGVRTDNVFSMDKVSRVLQLAQRISEPEVLAE